MTHIRGEHPLGIAQSADGRRQQGLWTSSKKRKPKLHNMTSTIRGLEGGSSLPRFHFITPAGPLRPPLQVTGSSRLVAEAHGVPAGSLGHTEWVPTALVSRGQESHRRSPLLCKARLSNPYSY